MKQNRLTSPVVWAAVLAQVLLVLTLFVTPQVSDTVKIVGFAAIEILTLFGVLNDPTNKAGF
jgi:uncharacterized membrane protein